VEIIVGSVDLRQHDRAKRSSLIELAWDIFDQLGGDQAEQQFFDEWKARKKAQQEAAAVRNKASRATAKKPKNQEHPWRATNSFLAKVKTNAERMKEN